MINPFNIALLIAILVFLIFSLLEDIIMGDKGKKNNIPTLYKYLKGIEEKKEKEKTIITKQKRHSYILYGIFTCITAFILALFTLKSLSMAFILSIFGLTFPHAKMKNAEKKEKELLNLQLKDALNSLTASLRAGMSINTALIKCTKDLEILYLTEKEKPMLEEFQKISNDLNMGMSVDEALINFKQRAQMEDVDDFVNSIIIVRQKGGNMVEVMNNVADIIKDKISINREIEILTAGKKAEAKIITVVPIIALVSISILSPTFLEPLYNNILGKILILIGFILLAINYYVGRHIVDIKV